MELLSVTAPAAIEFRRSPNRTAIFASTLPAELTDDLYHDPRAFLAQGETLRVNGARRTVRFGWQSRRFVLKHYVEPTWWHALKQSVQTSRAKATWTSAHRLADAGVLTPRPVACIENRLGPLRTDSFLVYPYVEGQTLRSCFKVEGGCGPHRQHLWRQLNELWRHLGKLKSSLADTNCGNFIVDEASRLWVIDLDKTRFHWLSYVAARKQQAGWRQLLGSARKCSSGGVP